MLMMASARVAPGLAITEGGLRMPETQLAALQAPNVLAAERPISPVISEREGSAFVPVAPNAPSAPSAPAVPTYPQKQSRH
tara:strand:+ start:166 stop:408 length:243 start_codon:yes stop_codon:yes gene_type:complete